MKPQISSRNLRSLSLYLDDQLSTAERQRLEKRLQGNQALRHALDEMQQTRKLLRSMPRMRAPHNFTLTPQMVEVHERRPVFPVMGFVSVLTSLLFVLVLAGDLFGIFTSSTRPVALQQMPALEAAAPVQGVVQEKRTQSEMNDLSTPSETQAEEAQALKAMAPPSDETKMESNDTLPPALLESGQEMSITATPALEEMYAKEAPAPGGNVPSVSTPPLGTPVMDVIEKELQPIASPTVEEVTLQAQAKQAGTDLTPPAFSQNDVPATEIVGAVELSNASSERSGASQDEAGEQAQNMGLSEEEISFEGQTQQITLRVVEAVFAVIALITAALFFIQRRKTIQ